VLVTSEAVLACWKLNDRWIHFYIRVGLHRKARNTSGQLMWLFLVLDRTLLLWTPFWAKALHYGWIWIKIHLNGVDICLVDHICMLKHSNFTLSNFFFSKRKKKRIYFSRFSILFHIRETIGNIFSFSFFFEKYCTDRFMI
jgi:hypothetical protein